MTTIKKVEPKEKILKKQIKRVMIKLKRATNNKKKNNKKKQRE